MIGEVWREQSVKQPWGLEAHRTEHVGCEPWEEPAGGKGTSSLQAREGLALPHSSGLLCSLLALYLTRLLGQCQHFQGIPDPTFLCTAYLTTYFSALAPEYLFNFYGYLYAYSPHLISCLMPLSLPGPEVSHILYKIFPGLDLNFFLSTKSFPVSFTLCV